MIKILTVVGARPQFIKSATIHRVLRGVKNIKEVIVHTGQHYDRDMNDIFFTQLEIPTPTYHLNINSSHFQGEQTAKILSKVEQVMLDARPDFVLVYGDTNSTLAAALAAAKLSIPIVHVEAGVRSYNRTMPEEINRIVTDSISEFLFAPTQTAVKCLEAEGLADKTIWVGDVMYDSFLHYETMVKKLNYVLPIREKEFYLSTIHRFHNIETSSPLQNILSTFEMLKFPVVFPIHPRTMKSIKKFMLKIPENVYIIPPVGYFEMLHLIFKAKKVITDSGGIQKEAYFMGKPCVTLRRDTEWPETLLDNRNILVGFDPQDIIKAVEMEVKIDKQKPQFFGNGKAAEKIVDYIMKI